MSGLSEIIPKDKVDVTVVCYNQEDTIIACLDGITSQLDVDIGSIIIHDDASTDNSAKLIQNYCKRYQRNYNFELIIRKDNIYHINPLMPGKAVFSHTKSKYVAILDGDDVWTDKYKLKSQLKILQECNKSLVFSVAEYHDISGELTFRPNKSIWPCGFLTCIINGGSHIPTSSIMFKRSLLGKFSEHFWSHSNYFDLPLKLIGTSEGAVFLPRVTTRIAKGRIGSFSYAKNRKHKKQIIHDLKQRIKDVLVVSKLLKLRHKYIFMILMLIRIVLLTLWKMAR